MGRNKIIPYRNDLKAKARELRKERTFSEALLWEEIRGKKLLGYQFHRQVPILDFIVDFYCHELQLAIEVDGISHSSKRAQAYDKKRQARLEEWGVQFLRFDDLRLKRDIENVLDEIRAWIKMNRPE